MLVYYLSDITQLTLESPTSIIHRNGVFLDTWNYIVLYVLSFQFPFQISMYYLFSFDTENP